MPIPSYHRPASSALVGFADIMLPNLQTGMNVGAVTDLQYINSAISTARKVMIHSLHTSLGGLQVSKSSPTPACSRISHQVKCLVKIALTP